MVYGYRIGGELIGGEEPAERVQAVPDNKTLMALELNGKPDDTANPIPIVNVDAAFKHYEPEVSVDLDGAEEGESKLETFKFGKLKDFNKDSLINQSSTLQDLYERGDIYSRFSDVLKTNGKLREILSDDEQKQAFKEMLLILINELEPTS